MGSSTGLEPHPSPRASKSSHASSDNKQFFSGSTAGESTASTDRSDIADIQSAEMRRMDSTHPGATEFGEAAAATTTAKNKKITRKER